MRNDCSVSGGWFLKALEHEYIDSSVLTVVFCWCRVLQGGPPRRRCVQFLGLHWLEADSLT